MKIQRVIKLKLNLKVEDILSTITAYTNSYNLVCSTGFHNNNFDKIWLHNQTYTQSRKILPAQLSISSRDKASETLKSNKSNYNNRLKQYNSKVKYYTEKNPKKLKYLKQPKYSCPVSEQCSIRYDARSYNIWFNKNQISLLTINKRIKCNFTVPKYFEQYLNWNRDSAELFIKDNEVFINIVFSKEVQEPEQSKDNVLGIDLGINKIAVTSNNKFYKSKKLKERIRKYEKLRSDLQKKNTKSSRRHLRKIKSREQLYRRDVNHCISKEIVNSLKPGSTIVMEDLTHIRETAKTRKEERKNLNKWSFKQLQSFIQYKSEGLGIRFELINPKNTSRTCCKCGNIDENSRISQGTYKCKSCGIIINADLNASRNIRNKYLSNIIEKDKKVNAFTGQAVNLPIVSVNNNIN